MRYEKEAEIAEGFFADCFKTLTGKAHDYASDKDALSNFKKVSQMCDIPTDKVFLMLMSIKIARLVELIDKDAVNESVEDSLRDTANYACLYLAYKREKNENVIS